MPKDEVVTLVSNVKQKGKLEKELDLAVEQHTVSLGTVHRKYQPAAGKL